MIGEAFFLIGTALDGSDDEGLLVDVHLRENGGKDPEPLKREMGVGSEWIAAADQFFEISTLSSKL